MLFKERKLEVEYLSMVHNSAALRLIGALLFLIHSIEFPFMYSINAKQSVEFSPSDKIILVTSITLLGASAILSSIMLFASACTSDRMRVMHLTQGKF